MRTDAPIGLGVVPAVVAVVVMLAAALGVSVRAAEPVSPGAPAPDIAQRAALKAAIGVPTCRSDAACWAVPVGARPCGGPEEYWPASRETADIGQIRRLAEDLAATRRGQHQASGRMGACVVMPEPASRCAPEIKRCELVAAGLAAR